MPPPPRPTTNTNRDCCHLSTLSLHKTKKKSIKNSLGTRNVIVVGVLMESLGDDEQTEPDDKLAE
ncbi:hypothetical protein BpHYR1_054605 [Brachionus plicatilis]|uniref:Uncharacterized protein n=1 Tax=Brachionus plicatilis TaxID=10195 RepID=A0A3M7RFL7_BRAPC|nr:hypothetical protein BpHYR1_054605 [Brachionus plicatilis]